MSDTDDNRLYDALPWFLGAGLAAGVAGVVVAAIYAVHHYEAEGGDWGVPLVEGKIDHPQRDGMNAMSTKRPTFATTQRMLLDGLRRHGWTVIEGLKVPHATYGDVRLWFRPQAIYVNDPGTNPRDFTNTHSLTSDMRELTSVEQLLGLVDRHHQAWRV